MKLDTDWWKNGDSLAVGSLGCSEDLTFIDSVESCADLLEMRLDLMLSDNLDALDILEKHQHIPLLVTARDPVEGGKGDFTLSERLDFLEKALPFSQAIDIEIRNLSAAKPLIAQAQAQGVVVIGSYHDFEKTPDEAVFMEKIMEATAAGVDVIKFAAKIHTLQHLEALTQVFTMAALPVAIMGMGPLGPVSRVLLAQHGSLLNYGYLGDHATAPGQWPVRLLKEAIASSPKI